MNKSLAVALLTCFSSTLLAVSMNFTGNVRTEADYYNKLSLGLPNVSGATKQFISSRFLLDPNLVVDDHFSVKSEWSLLSSPGFMPSSVPQPAALAQSGASTINLGPVGNSVGQAGYIYGDVSPALLVLSRAWLEWTTDFGVFRAGRMPFSWGYGLVWDAGNGVWDDYQTTLDRLEYRLHLGHVIGAVAYSKPRKLSVLSDNNDQNLYSVYIQYDNPEMEIEGGIIYEKQYRSPGQAQEYAQQANQYAVSQDADVPNATVQPPLAVAAPTPLSANLLDVYLKKTVGYFTLGGEVGWISGSAVNASFVQTNNMSSIALALNASYELHSVKAFVEMLYAEGDSNVTADHMNGFTILNRNRRPGLILGRELLGPYFGNQVAEGSPVYYGNQGSFSGVYYVRPGVRVDWSPAWTSGMEIIFAQKAAVQAGESASLGLEVDLGTDYIVYKNFEVGVNLGYLFPGAGLVSNVAGAPAPQGPFAVRGTGSLKF